MGSRQIKAILIAVCSAMMCTAAAWPRGKVTVRTMLDASGARYRETATYHDGLGRPVQTVQKGLNTGGVPVVTVSELNPDGTERRRWLPFAASGVTGRLAKTAIPALSSSSLSDTSAYSDVRYDALGRVTSTTTPGNAWHAASRAVRTVRSSNYANSVRMFIADDDGFTSDGYWPACSLRSEKTIDEDWHEVEVFTDVAGHTVLERRGRDHDTYYVYNAAGQLRFVLQPMYATIPIEDFFAFEYRYDAYGNVVYKSVPGGGSTKYWYDAARRVTFMEDENLRAKKLVRFFLYDKFGREAVRGVSSSATPSTALRTAEYTGGTTGFMQTGYTLSSSGITQATLEAVSYYDGYSFASALDTRLTQASAVSAKGRCTGMVVYDSGGTRSMTAIYYDIRGNVTSTRGIDAGGTLTVTESTYTFTDQPLTTKITESGGVTMLTSNVYDTSSGLLAATDVTVNGVRQRVAAFTYDNLGRPTSVKRGNTSQGGTVSYTYNVHGQVRTIRGPGFSQTLYYTDGPETRTYNGSVSAMAWWMHGSNTQRGYQYAYNQYGWLESATYGEGVFLDINKDRYTEKVTSFNRNGGITGLQRYGRIDVDTYVKADNLKISYYGNQVTEITDNGEAISENGSMDFPGQIGLPMKMRYDASGALIYDESRNIMSISYDNLGNPLHIDYLHGNDSYFVYSAMGEKLKATHVTRLASRAGFVNPAALPEAVSADAVSGVAGTTEFEYRGPFVYRDGKAERALFPGGYASLQGGVAFHFYTSDYLGNVRAVTNGSTGAIEQAVAYYPYGGIIADLGTGHAFQPYKFGEKELVTANGLNEYDFGARRYYQAVPMFTSPDPSSEKYPWLSPYLYCASDPVNAVDPDGREWRISSHRDENNKLHINIDFTGVVFEHTGRASDLGKLAEVIKTQIEDVFTFGEGNFDVTTHADIRVARKADQIRDTDHVFAIYSEKDLHPNNETFPAESDTGGLLIKMGKTIVEQTINGINKRTMAHEVGHTGGLDDNDSDIKSPSNNLMTQSKYLKTGTKNQATNIEVWQLNEIIRSYNGKRLNLRPRVYKTKSIFGGNKTFLP